MPEKRPAEEGLDELFFNTYREVGIAVRDVATDLAAQGSERAPIKTGALRGSIDPDVEFKIDMVKGEIRLDVIAATPYALIQHEREDFNHPLGGEAKYLTKPMAERAERYQRTIADAVEEAMRRSRA